MVRKQEPQIEIEDLQPKSSIAGYRATLKADGVAAHVELLPLQDQPARGFVLEVYTSNESMRPMGKRQQERANELIPLVKARMLEAMQKAGWSIVGRLGSPPMDVWQHSSRLAASSASKQDQRKPKQEELPQAERKTRARSPREVTVTCARCGQTVTRSLLPGPVPLYCSDACTIAAQREKVRLRVARLRANKKAGKEAQR